MITTYFLTNTIFRRVGNSKLLPESINFSDQHIKLVASLFLGRKSFDILQTSRLEKIGDFYYTKQWLKGTICRAVAETSSQATYAKIFPHATLDDCTIVLTNYFVKIFLSPRSVLAGVAIVNFVTNNGFNLFIIFIHLLPGYLSNVNKDFLEKVVYFSQLFWFESTDISFCALPVDFSLHNDENN